MATWTTTELDAIGAAEELEIAAPQADGSPAPGVPIWVVRVGDELYVRSWRGAAGAWYRRAAAAGTAHVTAGGVDRDVSADAPDDSVHAAIDREYARKYARHGSTYIEPMTAAAATAATLRLSPLD